MKSFFNRLFGNKGNSSGGDQSDANIMLEPVQVTPSLMLPRALANHFDQIKRSTR